MLSAIIRTVREHRLLERGDRVLVAVSGGPDSMALLAALWELRDRLAVTLEVATVDHGLRPEARLEAAAVADRAAALGLPFHRVEVDVLGARGGRAGSALQETARRLRLGALDDLARRRGARRIALGHQADDQAETVLFRILRGTGVRGLRGIPYERDRFIRPLLDVGRGQVLAYLRRRSIPFVEDPSNADLRFARARLRHRIIPALAQENPRVADALRALAADAARLGAADAGARAPAAPSLSAVGRRAAALVERLRREGRGTARVDVRGGRIEIAYGEAVFHPRGAAPADREAGSGDDGNSIIIDGPGDYRWAGALGVGIREGSAPAGVASFDADVVAGPLQLRRLRPGDRMKPRGGRGSRKISDLLIDAKIARARRAALPALTTCDGVVLFVPGLRPA